MITHKDQMELFRIVADSLGEDVTCYAFGGNAMMFYGYKEESKDVDLLFLDEGQRSVFIEAIRRIGFEEKDPIRVYIPEKLRDKNRPLMFVREGFRLDLFAGRIFRTRLSPRMREDFYALHEFRGKKTLKIFVLRKEHIVQLKAITERQNDFDDMVLILSRDSAFDWQYLIDEALWQHSQGDSWMLLDLEKALLSLRKYVLIEEKWLKQIYKGMGKKRENKK